MGFAGKANNRKKTLKVSSSGVSNIEYKGQAAINNYKTSTGSTIRKRGE
jgi:ribosomal protein S18